MKVAVSRVVFLVLLALSGLLEAQRTGPGPWLPDDQRCACWGEGADCLFGNASSCHIHCPGDSCSCSGAYCRFGFPFGSNCHC